MARPKGRTGAPKRLYLDPRLTKSADALAWKLNLSLSQFVENLLARELTAAGVLKK